MFVSPSANLSNSPLSFSKEYSNFSKLLKSCVSKAKAKCFTAIEIKESVSLTLSQCDLFFILSQFSISEIYIALIPWKSLPFISIYVASINSLVVIKIAFVSSVIAELKSKLLATNLNLHL